MTSLSERVKRAVTKQIPESEHSVVAEGIDRERERLGPLIEALAECAEVACLDYPNSTFKKKLEDALAEMEKG